PSVDVQPGLPGPVPKRRGSPNLCFWCIKTCSVVESFSKSTECFCSQMATYEHEIFISYRRTDTIGRWVKNHLVPRLNSRLDEIAPENVRIFCDYKMQSGTRWPDELKRQLRRSGLLLSIWSADYFRSDWCVAEWRSFRKREELLRTF